MSPIWPASESVPDRLMMYRPLTSSSKFFEWRPFQASDNQICGIYLEELAGPELYYVLELKTLAESQAKDTLAETVMMTTAPGYLMHAKSGKTFAFRSETSKSQVVLPVDPSANRDESKDGCVNGKQEANEDESEDESGEESEDESDD
jgi:hypothetical protein